MAKTSEVIQWARLELERYKSYIGFADWTIRISPSFKADAEALAGIDSDHYDKVLDVQLYNDFKGLPVSKKREVLIHELVHARIDVFQKKSLKLVEEDEESLANDLARAIWRMEEEK